MDKRKEIAKFACGAEAAHAVFHAVLLLSGTPLTVLGITVSPAWNVVGILVNGLVSAILGVYAWGPLGRRSA